MRANGTAPRIRPSPHPGGVKVGREDDSGQRLPVPGLLGRKALLVEVAAEPVELGRLDAVDVVGLGEVTAADLVAVAGDRGDHLLVDVGVALDEFGHVAGGDAEQVVKDEDLAGGGGPGADADAGNLQLGDDRLGYRGWDRLDHDREAADRLQRQGILAELDRVLGGLALGFVAAEGGGGLGSQADVAHYRDAGADDRPRPLDGDSPRLELDDLAAGLLDQAL